MDSRPLDSRALDSRPLELGHCTVGLTFQTRHKSIILQPISNNFQILHKNTKRFDDTQ